MKDFQVNSQFCMIKNSLSGTCGLMQPAANPLGIATSQITAELSHNLCNDFYINSFEHDFVANNSNNCPGAMSESALPPRFKMGYMETRRRSGDF